MIVETGKYDIRSCDLVTFAKVAIVVVSLSKTHNNLRVLIEDR